MKFETTKLKEYNGVKVGDIEGETTGKRTRSFKCISIERGDDGNIYAAWIYLLRRTMKPSGKSGIFLTRINC